MSQLSLFERTLDERFAEFMAERPEVYRMFCDLAVEAARKGRRRVGAKMLAELIRWEHNVRRGDAEFKLNNSFVSRMARKFQEDYPRLAQMFETRELKS